MKNIKIKELEVQNWKGQNFHDTYKENETRISGPNRSGKTTRLRAWQWLLTGYADAQTAANADLFDNREELTPQTPIASVKAVITIDGEEYTLQRTAQSKFIRKRGTDIYEKASSDEYKYYIDNIEFSATDYKSWLTANIAQDDMLRFVLSGDFFIAECFEDKRNARQIIEKLVGEVTREELTGDYDIIDALSNKYTLDQIDAQATNMIKGINARLTEIPTLIANANLEIAELEQTDFNAIDNEIADLEAERDNLDKQMFDLSERLKPQMEAKHEAERSKAMKQEMFDKAYAEWLKEQADAKQRLTDEINAVKKQNAESKKAYDAALDKRNEAIRERDLAIEDLRHEELKRERLIAERDAEKAKMREEDTVCAYCGTPLSAEKMQEVADRFESIRRERLDEIVSEGKRTALAMERLNKKIDRMQDVIDEPLPQVIEQPTDDMEERLVKMSSVAPTFAVFSLTEKAEALIADIESVVIPEVVMPNDTEIKAKKADINARLTSLYEKRGLKTRVESLKTTAADLRTEQREKGANLAQYERQRAQVKNYRQEQMQVLSKKVNDSLRFSRIDVWSTQKDGTVIPDLVLRDSQGVNYSTTNNASRIITAVDIQRFFCSRLGVNMPTWIDESSVLDAKNLPKMSGIQTFFMFCSDEPLKIDTK